MFKQASNIEELVGAMEKNLISNNIEKSYNFNKIAKALDLLNKAAEIFDDHGFSDEAKMVEDLLIDINDQISK